MDGSTTQEGSGIGILLVSPQGDEIKVTVQLCFKASNNETECEAVLAGVQTTKYVGAVKVILYSDSQLVAQQLDGVYEIRNDRMRKYTEVYKKLKNEFQEIVL